MPGAVHPPRRARVPAPSAAAAMGRMTVDIARHHVGLDPVARDVGRVPGVIHRIEHVEHLGRLVAASEPRQRHHDPDGRVRVLPAVLANARRVALDVARVLRRDVERWMEQQQGLGAASDEERADAVHRPLGEPPRHRARQHRPRLRRSSRFGIHRSAPNRAACRRRSSRGDTTRRPTRARAPPPDARLRRDSDRRAHDRRGCRRVARTPSGRCAGKTRATCSLPGRGCRRGSSRHSSRRCRRAAGRARPAVKPLSMARTQCSKSVPVVG